MQFQVSNVTGHNLDLLRSFLNILPQKSATKFDTEAPFELQISDIFSVPFVGTVVSGVITSGTVRTGDNLLIGPDSLGQFLQTAVRSIEVSLRAYSSAALADWVRWPKADSTASHSITLPSA